MKTNLLSTVSAVWGATTNRAVTSALEVFDAPLELLSGNVPLPLSGPLESMPAAIAVAIWDGVERRSGVNRRQSERRQEGNSSTLLDTRCQADRRRFGRRASDLAPLSPLSLLV